jgi:hypothetical protein
VILPLLAGNSSPPLTLSGISSEGIAPTGGRYGFVALVSSPPPTTEDPLCGYIGLLPRARGHHFGRGSQHDRFGYYNSNKLPGEFRVPRLARYHV